MDKIASLTIKIPNALGRGVEIPGSYARHQGYYSAAEGKERVCPYKAGTPDFICWNQGYDQLTNSIVK